MSQEFDVVESASRTSKGNTLPETLATESMDKSDNNHEIRLAAAKRTDHDSLEFVQV